MTLRVAPLSAGERAPQTSRFFRCRVCSETFPVATLTGPLPSTCATCDPEGAARRRTDRNSTYRKRKAEVLALRVRVAELERLLAVDAAITTRAAGLDLSDPDTTGRALVGRAVRQVAHAEGKAATRDALLNLAAAARAWVRVIDGPTGADLDAEPDLAGAA